MMPKRYRRITEVGRRTEDWLSHWTGTVALLILITYAKTHGRSPIITNLQKILQHPYRSDGHELTYASRPFRITRCTNLSPDRRTRPPFSRTSRGRSARAAACNPRGFRTLGNATPSLTAGAVNETIHDFRRSSCVRGQRLPLRSAARQFREPGRQTLPRCPCQPVRRVHRARQPEQHPVGRRRR